MKNDLSFHNLTTKLVVRLGGHSRAGEHCGGEGHSAAGWGIGGSAILQTAWSKVCSFGQWAAATCAAPPSVIAGQYATLHCKPMLVMFM